MASDIHIPLCIICPSSDYALASYPSARTNVNDWLHKRFDRQVGGAQVMSLLDGWGIGYVTGRWVGYYSCDWYVGGALVM